MKLYIAIILTTLFLQINPASKIIINENNHYPYTIHYEIIKTINNCDSLKDQITEIKKMTDSKWKSTKISSFLISGKHNVLENIDTILKNIDLNFKTKDEYGEVVYYPGVDSILLYDKKHGKTISKKIISLIEKSNHEIKLKKYFELLGTINGGWKKYYEKNKDNFSKKFNKKIEKFVK